MKPAARMGPRLTFHDKASGITQVVDFPLDKDFEVLAQVEKRMDKLVAKRYDSPTGPAVPAAGSLPPTAGECRAPTLPGQNAEAPLSLPGGASPENPARNRTEPVGAGAPASSGARDVGRTPTCEPTGAPREVERDRAEGSGGRERRQDGDNGGPDAAHRPSIRDTSMAAYRALTYSGKLADQQRRILDLFLSDPGRTRTRQELARSTGLGINAVCGRVNELLDEPFNLLVEVGRKMCEVTGNNVNAIALATQEPEGER